MSKKFAIVTGGTRGIGRAISLALAHDGATVLALYARDRKSADSLEEEAKLHRYDIRCVRGDLTDEAKLQETVQTIKQATKSVDILVHSAASGVHRNALELSHKHMAWTFDINVFAIHDLIREIVPMMPPGGRVIGVTSHGGVRVIPFYSAVGSSKGALESLFRHYAAELAPKGISVNLVCPGMILTDAIEAFPNKEARVDMAVKNTPTGRLTTAEEVGKVVTFLCSEAASQIVGQTIVVDGGKNLWA